MAGWTITCNSGGECPAEINPVTGLAKFSANTGTTDIIYTITYTDDDGNCGSTTITQPGNCSGGGGDTCEGITISGNVNTPDGQPFTDGGTLEIEGGTLVFTHSEPAPVPPHTEGWDKDANAEDVIRIAVGSLQDGPLDKENGWIPCFSGTDKIMICCSNKNKCYLNAENYSDYETVTVKITNNLRGLYIPFNAGKFRINGKYACFRGVTNCGNGSLQWRYGSKSNKGFDTNYLVPPGKTITLSPCHIFAAQGSPDGRSEFGFGILKSYDEEEKKGDYYVHTDDANTNYPDNFGIRYGYDTTNKTATFNITGGTWWDGRDDTRHYALEWDNVKDGFIKFEYNGGDKAAIIATHIGKIADGTWDYGSMEEDDFPDAYASTFPDGMTMQNNN